ncbi:hypothetical protein N7489_005844 [Penicillium chrysogenum]|uniref:uncharacterized protein n=1 Tax=Penicillium chrysogenum TaxID=5076 RepID=UPI00239C5EFF|nr:uncharacterized protein N7489_005844 [Penicillium chrysogenum]KAJ5245748.1 hypothetical protein N7489_005844 [Penicillium chrysogenum]KAJ5259680.1 hypothetical protein N7524_008742 [Penicillium chrysogenum]KAJ6136703.1 hypothetical protein N7497_012407 [Penicillium chrysogenum]
MSRESTTFPACGTRTVNGQVHILRATPISVRLSSVWISSSETTLIPLMLFLDLPSMVGPLL